MACINYPPCTRCSQAACDHDAEPATHPVTDPEKVECEGYQFPPGMDASDFEGGGGSSDGDGSSGGW